MEEDSQRVRLRLHRQTQLIVCCKRFIAFLFSHIGLAAMVVAYSILGGFLFMVIENSYAIELKQSYEERLEKLKNQTIARILKILTTDACAQLKSSAAGWNTTCAESAREILDSFQKSVRENLALRRIGKPTDSIIRLMEDDDQWSFAASLLFAVTVITTIGM